MMTQLEICKVLDKETAAEILEVVTQIEEPRWTKRDELVPGRRVGEATCRYDICSHVSMKKETQEYLKKFAPQYEDFFLSEIVINRYAEGDYLGPHKDRQIYRRNLVIALQEQGDGLMLNESNEFIEDVAGQGVLINGVGPVHSVPAVKNKRYTLVYLYE
jgi:hypothetical protein